MLLKQIKPLYEGIHDAPGEVIYHKDIGFPDDLVMPRGFSPVLSLEYSAHARNEAMSDKYGNLQLPQRVDLRVGGTIIEVGAVGNVCSKVVFRMSYDAKRDIVLVIKLPTGFVKTVWANEKSDQHRKLDRSRYADPNARMATPN